jgi:ferric-dicitrate binding protein FerR (iron transport regulator)
VNSHDETQELLDYLDGTMASQEKESMLDRMQQDPDLRREYETLAALARGLEEAPDEPVPAGFVDEFMAAHAQPSFSQKLASFFETFKSPATASVALAGGLAAVALFVMPGAGGDAGSAKPLAGCTLVAQAGLASINGQDRAGEVELRLEDTVEVDDTFEGELRYPDGTTIKLSAGTAVQVRSRGLRLRQGGVWLEVTKDLKGFQVETPLALAAVKGTEFTVEYDGEAPLRGQGRHRRRRAPGHPDHEPLPPLDVRRRGRGRVPLGRRVALGALSAGRCVYAERDSTS